MAEQPTIDPRYDPAFQRGFDGPVATGSRSEVAARRSAPYVTSALQRPDTDRPSAAKPDVAAQIGLPPASALASDDEAQGQTDVVVVQAAEQPLRPPWTNPFAIAVFVLGVIVLGVGAWILQEGARMAQSTEGFETQADYWYMQISLVAAPITLGLGIAILAGVLFLCAAYWARRPASYDVD